MPAHAFFTATTTNLFIENIKTQAEGYGWIIDFFGIWSGQNRLHLHNAAGAHFEIWYNFTDSARIAACTGYSAASAPTAQPGVSGSGLIHTHHPTDIVCTPNTVFIKCGYVQPRVMHFGTMVNKLGVWSGGTFFSSTQASGSFGTFFRLWEQTSSVTMYNQMLIDGVWSALSGNTSTTNIVHGALGANALETRMPFKYSAGIIPVPLLLVQRNGAGNKVPLGYAPDVYMFSGGDVYAPLEVLTIGGVQYLALNATGAAGTYTDNATLLIRLAS